MCRNLSGNTAENDGNMLSKLHRDSSKKKNRNGGGVISWAEHEYVDINPHSTPHSGYITM